MKQGTKTVFWTTVAAAMAAVIFMLLVPDPKMRPLKLTPEERAWLTEHATAIRLAPLPDAPPIDFVDSGGRHCGLSADYLRLIEEQLGIEFKKVYCKSWKEIIEGLQRQEIDLVASVQKRHEREKYLLFSEPYMSVRNVILTRKGWGGVYTLDDMTGMRIVIVEGSANYEYVRERHPEYDIIPVAESAQGFRMVSFSQADAMVADLGVASYYIEEMGISNLRVAGNIDYPWELCLASRKDWPLLNSILNKALANIPPDQRRKITAEWITLRDAAAVPQERYLKIIGLLLIVTLVAIGSIMFWNRNLRRKVTTHSLELGRVRERHEQAAQALGLSEERYRALVESSGDMIWETDRVGAYTYVSPRAFDILGYDPEELEGKSSLSFMLKEDAAVKTEAIRHYTPASTINCEVSTFRHKNGSSVILESSGMAFVNAEGNYAGMRGVSRDITARIEAQRALRRSEERFRNLVETTSDWIWEVDTQGIYIYSSPQSMQLLGYPPNELIGKHFTAHMPPKEAEAMKSIFADTIKHGAPIHSLMNTNRHADGRTVVLETSAVPFYDKDWNILGYRGIDRDITNRVETEKRLEFERSLFRSFMAHAPDLIYFKDNKGCFIEVNAAKAAELHMGPEDLIGRTDFDFFTPEEARQRFEDEQEIIRTRKAIQKEEACTTPDGIRWYLTTKVPRYDEKGDIVGTFGTSWDITFRKQAEQQLAQLRSLLSNSIDSMPSILVGVDTEGNVIQWNRQAAQTAGISAEEAIGKPLRETFPELVPQMVKVERAIRERSAQREERIAEQHESRTRYHDITVYPLLDDNSKGAVIRVDDVTSRVMIEDSIRNIVEGVAAVGRKFFSSMVSQMAKTLGADFTFIAEYADDEHQTMRTIAVSDKGEISPNFEFVLAGTPSEAVLKNRRCMVVENVLSAYSGTEQLKKLDIKNYIGIPLVDSNHQNLGIMVALYRGPVEHVEFATSIMQVFAGRTAAELERLQASKEMAALRNMLQSIINSMPSILAGIDADGRVVHWNREAEEATGISAGRAHGQPIEAVFAGFGGEMSRMLASVGNGDAQRDERIHCTIKNAPRIADVTIYPITTDGKEGAVIRVDDVTDRVRIEEMMVQSEKMMSVGGLAAGMAHEINNPLAGILQNLQVMRNRITHDTERNVEIARNVGTSLEAIQAYMEERGLIQMMDSISEAGRRAAKVVDNMLSFSRKDEAHFLPHNLAEIIERGIELASNDYNLKKRFDFRHIHIVREFEALPEIRCEGSQILQVLLNLLSNSAQAMAGSGTKKPTITLRLKHEFEMALIEVEDNGPGMAADIRKRVFEPFFTTKEVGQGTGLGLSVSYFIITENHGGAMSVTSSPGKGACFSVRIPYKHRTERWGLRL